MNINIDSLTCGKCGHRIDVEWYTHDPSNKEYRDAANAGIIDIYEDNKSLPIGLLVTIAALLIFIIVMRMRSRPQLMVNSSLGLIRKVYYG